jgi:hypothetical protein
MIKIAKSISVLSKRREAQTQFLCKMHQLNNLQKYNTKQLKNTKFLARFDSFMIRSSQKIENEPSLVRFMQLTNIWPLVALDSNKYTSMSDDAVVWDWIIVYCLSKVINHGHLCWSNMKITPYNSK